MKADYAYVTSPTFLPSLCRADTPVRSTNRDRCCQTPEGLDINLNPVVDVLPALLGDGRRLRFVSSTIFFVLNSGPTPSRFARRCSRMPLDTYALFSGISGDTTPPHTNRGRGIVDV